MIDLADISVIDLDQRAQWLELAWATGGHMMDGESWRAVGAEAARLRAEIERREGE